MDFSESCKIGESEPVGNKVLGIGLSVFFAIRSSDLILGYHDVDRKFEACPILY